MCVCVCVRVFSPQPDNPLFFGKTGDVLGRWRTNPPLFIPSSFFAPATAADCTVGAGRPTTRSDEAKKKPKEEEVDEYNWEKERKEEEKNKRWESSSSIPCMCCIGGNELVWGGS